jgi:hypothetical protein
MTLFNERERAFENLFAHEEEVRFLAQARRNHLFAQWAAEQLGLRGSKCHRYIRSFAEGAVRPEPEEALIDHVRTDFLGSGVEASLGCIRAAMEEAAAQAMRQIRAEARSGRASSQGTLWSPGPAERGGEGYVRAAFLLPFARSTDDRDSGIGNPVLCCIAHRLDLRAAPGDLVIGCAP